MALSAVAGAATRRRYQGFETFSLATDRADVHLVNDGELRRQQGSAVAGQGMEGPMKPMGATLTAAVLAGSIAFATTASAQHVYAPSDGAYRGQAYNPGGGEQTGYGQGYRTGSGPQAYGDRNRQNDAGQRDYGQGYRQGGEPQAYRDRTQQGDAGQRGYDQGYRSDLGERADDRGYRDDGAGRAGYGRGYGADSARGFGDERAYARRRDGADRGYAGDYGGYRYGRGYDGGYGYDRDYGYGGGYGYGYGRDYGYDYDYEAAPYDSSGYDEYSGFVAPPISGPEVYGYGPEDQRAYYTERRRCGCGW
jgi:hypothetical protein